MRKQTKLVAVLSAAALLAIGASMTSFAAAGWAQEDGVWVWLDKDGDRVTDTWKKSGTGYYYLNEDGEMAVDTVVEDDDYKYYVDASGVRVTNRWVSVDNEEDEEIGGNDDITTIWYYFGANGRAYKAKDGENQSPRTVDGKKYLFDDAGHMLSGWQIIADETDATKKDIYYLGGENEGWAASGWQYLEPEENMAPEDGEYDDEEWFYFSTSNGKASRDKRQYIGGKYYAFDDNGVMQNKWLLATITNVATPSRYKDKEDGSQATGWVYAYPLDDPDEEGDDQFWYYLDSKGIPFNYGGTSGVNADKMAASGWGTDKAKNVEAKVLKNKTYLFDENGKMLTGVFKIKGDVEKLDAGIYYFTKGGGSAEGTMVTGKTSVTFDDETINYYFQKSGQAYTWTIMGGSLYDGDGARVDAEDGNTYEPITLSDLNLGANVIYDGKNPTELVATDKIIVNANGKIKKSGNVKIDGTTYKVEGYKVVEEKTE